VQRAQIVALACLEPLARGLHITHWSSEDLARQAVADKIVPDISSRTIRRTLQNVDLQPHRTRYWKTSRLDAEFKQRAEKILWGYANAAKLAARGIWVVCVDEMPNLQVLERPIRRAIPGSIEHQEFEYTRHGTVNVLMFLVVHTGKMHAVFPETKDADHYVSELKRFRRAHRHLKSIYLIQDGDPSHTAAKTEIYFRKHTWWRRRLTPVHTSWLNQAEILNHTFAQRYLKRASRNNRQELIDQVKLAEPEYNRRYAHPVEWTWTNQKMHDWFEKHSR
jgi:DDE superfamily endonuclease